MLAAQRRGRLTTQRRERRLDRRGEARPFPRRCARRTPSTGPLGSARWRSTRMAGGRVGDLPPIGATSDPLKLPACLSQIRRIGHTSISGPSLDLRSVADGLLIRRAQDPQVAPASLDPRRGLRNLPRRLPDGVRERDEIIRAGCGGLTDLEPDDLPTQRRGEPRGMSTAEVVRMGLRVRRKGSEHRSRIRIHVGQGRHGRLAAGGTRTTAKRAHVREG